MRVGIDLTALELDVGGTKRYVEALRNEWENSPDVELEVVRHEGLPAGSSLGRVRRGLTRNFLYYRRTLPQWISRKTPDVFFCPTPLGPSRSNAPMVMAIHDMLAWDRPFGIGGLNAMQIRFNLAAAKRATERVLACSAHTRERVIDVLGFEPENVKVIPLGVDDRFGPGSEAERADAREVASRLIGGDYPFILTVGPIGTRKNPERVLRSLAAVAAAGLPHHVVSTGLRGADDQATIASLLGGGLSDRVHVTGLISDDELIALYRACDCFVITSLYEGFGLPPLEAMACAAPVISSDRTSLPEVVGEAAILIDPEDPGQLEHELVRVLTDRELTNSLCESGLARAREFSWRRTAAATAQIFTEVSRG